ncbi:MAG TPA: helix-turn-helix domain-containing protein [Ktedonobacterales bacterium]|nr:helix-turn-helix domain-containing protein [Ktedonobacterales bacterium]
MPKLLAARPSLDAAEEHQVRRLARSHHAPADWVLHAQMIARSWEGLRTRASAEELDCHPQTVREHFHAFNARGRDGLGMKPGSGRKPRLTEAERSAVIALVASPPPGRLVTSSDGTLAPAGSAGGDVSDWSLDALAAAAHAQGIQIGRSQVRRMLRKEGVRWRRTHSWAQRTAKGAKDFAPKGRRSSPATPPRRVARRPSASTNSAP